MKYSLPGDVAALSGLPAVNRSFKIMVNPDYFLISSSWKKADRQSQKQRRQPGRGSFDS